MYLPNVLFATNSPITYVPFPFRMKACSCSAALLKGFPKQVVLLPSFSGLHVYSGPLQTLASSYNLLQPFPSDGIVLVFLQPIKPWGGSCEHTGTLMQSSASLIWPRSLCLQYLSFQSHPSIYKLHLAVQVFHCLAN